MSYPTVSVKRTSKIEKAMALGQGRIAEGTIVGSFRTFQSIIAGSFGLKSVRSIHLTPGTPFRAGTPVTFWPEAQVNDPGSPDNRVFVSCRQHIEGEIRIGTPRYTTFNPAFVATPVVVDISPGSPVAGDLGGALVGGTPFPYWLIHSIAVGSFQHMGTPTVTGYFQAKGPGSTSLYYTAYGP